ncbi:MAG: helicase-related protein [Flavobacteriaceae bacterium]
MTYKINPKKSKKLEDFFIENNYKVKFLPKDDLVAFDEYSLDNKPPNEDRDWQDIITSPILVENEKNGDLYEIYYTKNNLGDWASDYSLKSAIADSILFDNENNIIKNINAYDKVYFDLVKKGEVFGLTGSVISEDDLLYNEFANFDKFEDVDAPDYSLVYADNPQVSEATFFDGIEKISEQQVNSSLEKIKKEENDLIEKLKSKEDGTLKSAMWTIDEVDNIYNTSLSSDDKRAWVIFLQNKARKKLEGEFIKKYDSEYPAKPETILELMKKGCLFFDPNSKVGERLQPRSVYRAGNIWLKRSALDNQSELYINRFGEELFELHKEVIKDVWVEAWDNRLKLNTKEKSQRLALQPISALAETFKIESFISPKDRSRNVQDFVINISRKKGEIIEDITTLRESTNNWDTNIVKRNLLSLKDAFITWCKQAGSGNASAEYGIQWTNTTRDINDIINRYLKPTNNPFAKEKNGAMKWARYKDDARKVGNRLFAQFLAEGLNKKDQQKIEIIFNSTYNYDFPIKLDEVPIGFTYKKYLDNQFLFLLRDSNLNAIRNYVYKGSIGLAYGVGLGKTFCSIFIMKQALDFGLVKRPIVIVPNQVYSQFINEISRGLGKDFNANEGGTRINGFYNGQGELYNKLGNNAVDGINICTYEATLNFVYDEKRIEGDWFKKASLILESGNDNLTDEHRQEFEEKYKNSNIFAEFDIDSDDSEDLTNDFIDIDGDVINEEDDFDDFDLLDEDDVDEFEEGGEIESEREPIKFPIFLNSENNDFDMVVVDEAHNFNALFSSVKAPPKENQTLKKRKDTGKLTIQRDINPYSEIRETGGKKESARAERLWFLSRYIQSKSSFNNTILLSATPFTNSPLQVFSMISYINYELLENSEIGNLKDFFDVFAKIEFAEDFKTDLSIVKRNKLVGWTNVVALQKFVFYVFDKSSREDEDKAVIRPNKIVLPLKQKMIDGKLYQFDKANYVSTTIQMSNKQKTLWNRVRDYASGKENPITGNPYTFDDIASKETLNTTSYITKTKTKKKKEDSNSNDDSEIVIDNPDDLVDGTIEQEKEKNNVKALQCLMWGRQITLNPYLFKWSGDKTEPTSKEYVEQSPKLLYTMLCIKSVKDYHSKSKDSPYMSGQVIYMNFGVKAFRLLRDYLVTELGFDYKEIGIISGKGNFIGKKLYGDKQDVADAFLGRKFNEETKSYEKLDEKNRVKVLIGSEAIKEGINLQNYASVLYNCFLDFNPTDTIQVEGRIWRQGNAFANVRIVTPLISDSIDIFMFQKLEDKTERINQIWTRNGNANEIDTTSFNPADLKYELVTDPIVIAQLEREYKKEQIDEEITEIAESRSSLLNLKALFTERNKITDVALETNIARDKRYSIYYSIMQVRCDLLQKPLLNKEFYTEFLKKYCKKENQDFNEMFRYRPNIYEFENNYELRKYREEAKIGIDEFFNYSYEELIRIMATIIKDKKIAFPYGYSPNWRELVPKKEIPIIEGEEVEYTTKKGVKKGICSDVRNSYEEDILDNFLKLNFNKEIYDEYFIKNASKETKKEIENLLIPTDTYLSWKQNIVIDEENLQILQYLLKQYYQYHFDNKMEMGTAWKPTMLDVGEVEDMSIEDKNIKPIRNEKDSSVEPKPTPEPFTFNNKKRNEYIYDIILWTRDYYFKYVASEEIKELYYDTIPRELLYKNPSENFLNIKGAYKNNLGRIFTLLTDDDIYYITDEDLMSKINNKLDDETWGNLIDTNFKDYLFKNYFVQFYEIDYPAKLKEFDLAYEKRLKPMGIEKENDLQIIIDEKQTEVNSLKLEQSQLDNEEVFEELVEEVVRRMAELNSEEVRAGSSFIKRAESFANSNPDYDGNKLLSIFRKDIDKKPKKSSKKEEQVIDKVEVIETEQETTIETINEKIEALKELMEIYDEKDDKFIEIKEIIDALEELKEVFN